MIQFPCPKSISAMTPIEGGYYCNYCKEEVLDITNLSDSELIKWKTENSSSCVVINEQKNSSPKATLSYFALALMIVGGSTYFNFSSAQMQDEIMQVKGELTVPENPSLGLLRVNVVNQYGHPTWGNAWVELPNGKELELYEMEEGKFYVEIPAYCKGKALYVYAEHLGKKKHVSTVMYQLGEELEVSLVFKSHRKYKSVVRGKF